MLQCHGLPPIPKRAPFCRRAPPKEGLVQVTRRGLGGATRLPRPGVPQQDLSRCLPAQSMLVLADLEMFRVWAETEMSSWSTGLW